MTEYEEILSNTNDYQSDSSDDTDEELKEAFAAGLLKPGLNYMGEAPEKKVAKNNVTGLKQKLSELQRNLPWVRNWIQLISVNSLYLSDRESLSHQRPRAPGSRAGHEGGFTREGEREENESRQGKALLIPWTEHAP